MQQNTAQTPKAGGGTHVPGNDPGRLGTMHALLKVGQTITAKQRAIVALEQTVLNEQTRSMEALKEVIEARTSVNDAWRFAGAQEGMHNQANIQLKDVREQLQEYTILHGANTQELEALTARVNLVQEQLDNSLGRVKELELELAFKDGRVVKYDQMERDLRTIHLQKNSMTIRDTQQRELITRLEKELTEVKNERDTLKEANESMAADIYQKDMRLVEANGAYARLGTMSMEMDTLKSKVSKLTLEMGVKQGVILSNNILVGRIGQTAKTNAELEEIINTKDCEIARLTESLNDSRAQFDELTIVYEEVKAELSTQPEKLKSSWFGFFSNPDGAKKTEDDVIESLALFKRDAEAKIIEQAAAIEGFMEDTSSKTSIIEELTEVNKTLKERCEALDAVLMVKLIDAKGELVSAATTAIKDRTLETLTVSSNLSFDPECSVSCDGSDAKVSADDTLLQVAGAIKENISTHEMSGDVGHEHDLKGMTLDGKTVYDQVEKVDDEVIIRYTALFYNMLVMYEDAIYCFFKQSVRGNVNHEKWMSMIHDEDSETIEEYRETLLYCIENLKHVFEFFVIRAKEDTDVTKDEIAKMRKMLA